jgi:methyl-accepting chemotaxis protein
VTLTLERGRDGIEQADTRTRRELDAVALGVQTGEAITALMDSLLAAAEQLTRTAEQIRAGTHEQLTGSRQAAANLQDLVATSHQLARYSGAVSTAATQLDDLAQQLDTELTPLRAAVPIEQPEDPPPRRAPGEHSAQGGPVVA